MDNKQQTTHSTSSGQADNGQPIRQAQGGRTINNNALQTLAVEMDEALKSGQAKKFNSLVKKHSRMIHKLFDTKNSSQLPADLLAKLTDEHKRWIAKARLFLKHTRDKIDKLQPRKNTTRQISKAYANRPSGAGRLISRKG